MKTVWKYPLSTSGDAYTIQMPKGAFIVRVAAQGRWGCVWAQVDPNETLTEARKFRVIGTGEEIGDEYLYRGTFESGPFVFHVYEDIDALQEEQLMT